MTRDRCDLCGEEGTPTEPLISHHELIMHAKCRSDLDDRMACYPRDRAG